MGASGIAAIGASALACYLSRRHLLQNPLAPLSFVLSRRLMLPQLAQYKLGPIESVSLISRGLGALDENAASWAELLGTVVINFLHFKVFLN